MAIYRDSNIAIYFGDATDSLFLTETDYKRFAYDEHFLQRQPFAHITQNLNIKEFIFARQVHGTLGHAVETIQPKHRSPFSLQGDYLITNKPALGIGILTADCLPIILYDPDNTAVAIIHAGWRGSVQGVALKALQRMGHVYNSQPTSIHVWFGPSAQPCCYNVGHPVIQKAMCIVPESISEINGETFFDNIRYNQHILETAGIPAPHFNRSYADCTICCDNFWSYRRQKESAGRQITAVCIIDS